MQALVWEEEIRWLRMNAVFYLLYAMRFFWGKSLEEGREIAIGICLQGQHGPKIANHRRCTSCWRCPGESSRRWSWDTMMDIYEAKQI